MDLSEHIARARVEGRINGLALALTKNGEIIQRFSGHSDQHKQLLVTEQSIFPAASLSKPVFACTVLKLMIRTSYRSTHPSSKSWTTHQEMNSPPK